MRAYVSYLALAILCSTSVANGNSLINGGFEVPVLGAGAFETISPGGEPVGFTWIVSSGNVDVGHLPIVPFVQFSAFEGNQGLDLNGTQRGAIFQDFTTIAGQFYELTFAYADNPSEGGVSSASIRVSDVSSNVTLLSDSVSHSTSMNIPGGADISFYSGFFRATSSTTRLEIASTSASNSASGGILLDAVNVSAAMGSATVTNRFVYYSSWSGAGNSLDSSKQLYKQTETPTTLSFENLTNAAQGITGIGFDIQNIGNPITLSVSDFEVRVSPAGAFDEGQHPPSVWQLASVPSVSVSSLGNSHRIQLEWNSMNSSKNRWIRITIKANTSTGLAADETYYIGHLLGETTGAVKGNYTVAFADINSIRSLVGQTVGAGSIADIDKSGIVAFADINSMRSQVGTQLTNITVP